MVYMYVAHLARIAHERMLHFKYVLHVDSNYERVDRAVHVNEVGAHPYIAHVIVPGWWMRRMLSLVKAAPLTPSYLPPAGASDRRYTYAMHARSNSTSSKKRATCVT
jgi:hypothetical protein